MMWDEIKWSELDGVKSGHAQDEVAKTGVTALVFPKGATAGVWTVSYTHLTLPTKYNSCRSRWSPYH